MKHRRHIAHIKSPRPKPACVYHFTSTLHLPWIVMDGELRPSIHGNDFNRRYVWATTNPDGDPTAFPTRPINNLLSAFWSERGQLLIVRLTLPAAGFVRWDEVKKTVPRKWRVEVQESDDIETKWRLRRDPVPLKSVLRVDVGAPGHWSRIKATRKHCHEFSDDPPTMSFEIDGFHYYSMMVGAREYEVPDREELAEMWDGEWPEDWHA